ncbi:MAG TPA: SRPBCC domain-containing protein [Longimicrobium sp.]|nr:SRPBCC domain-containing protein [Longimicrobium sp.]
MTTTTADSPFATTFSPQGDREVVMTRTFRAPRELVWRAITEPRHFARWWGPRDYTCAVRELDVRPGGRWEAEQTAPNGNRFRFWGEYLEVERPELLVHTQHFMEFPPLVVTITLSEYQGQTTLTSVTRFDSPQGRTATLEMGMEWGARQSIDRLAELVESL